MGAKSNIVGAKKKRFGAKVFLETYATTLGVQGFTLIQGIVLARVLGADGRGEYAAIVLWPIILGNCGLFGSRMSITRAIASSGATSIVRAGLILSLILSGISVLVGVALLPALMPASRDELLWITKIFMVIYIPAFIFSSNLAALDHGRGNFSRLNLFRALLSPVNVLILLALIVLGRADLPSCVIAAAAALWVVCVGRAVLLLRETPLLGPIASLRSLVRKSVPFALTGVLGQVNHRSDRILLLWLMTDVELGLYVVAYGVASVVAQAPKSIGLISVTVAAQEREREGYTLVARMFRSATVLAVLMAIGTAGIIYWALPLMYGVDFSAARLTAVILCAAFVPLGLNSLLAQTMAGQGKPLAGMMARMLGTLIMAIVAYLLKDSMGVNGVALGFLASQIVSLAGLLMLVLKHYHSADPSALIPTVNDGRLIFYRLWERAMRALRKLRIVSKEGAQ